MWGLGDGLGFARGVGGVGDGGVFGDADWGAACGLGFFAHELDLVTLDGADDGGLVKGGGACAGTETDESLAGADAFDHVEADAAEDLLGEGGEVAEHPDEIEALPESEPEVTGPNWSKDFHNTAVQLVGHAQPAYTGGLPDDWTVRPRTEAIMALGVRGMQTLKGHGEFFGLGGGGVGYECTGNGAGWTRVCGVGAPPRLGRVAREPGAAWGSGGGEECLPQPHLKSKVPTVDIDEVRILRYKVETVRIRL